MLKNCRTQPCCALCFESIQDSLGFLEALWYEENLCYRCHLKMNTRCAQLCVGDHHVYALHEYTPFVRNCIIQYKDLGDQYLARIFLSSFKWRVYFFYHHYVVVCVPSSFISRQQRGFDHVALMAKTLGLVIVEDVIVNTSNLKQREKTKSERLTILDNLVLCDTSRIKNKCVLLVDDVLTTGSSMMACFSLLEPHVKSMCGLVAAFVPNVT